MGTSGSWGEVGILALCVGIGLMIRLRVACQERIWVHFDAGELKMCR